jgi:hypothetical protein
MPAAQVRGLPIITKPYGAQGLCERVGELIRSAAG